MATRAVKKRRTGAARKKAARKKAARKKAVPKKAAPKRKAAATRGAKAPAKKTKPLRKGPTTEVDAEALDFIRALDAFKKEHNRPFPTWSEVLDVLKRMGYRRVKS